MDKNLFDNLNRIFGINEESGDTSKEFKPEDSKKEKTPATPATHGHSTEYNQQKPNKGMENISYKENGKGYTPPLTKKDPS